MIASDFMTTELQSCDKSMTLSEAALIMMEKGFSALPVIDDKEGLVGVITDSSFICKEVSVPHAVGTMKQLFGEKFRSKNVEEIYSQAKTKKLSELMQTKFETVSPDTSLDSIVNLMNTKDLERLFVTQDSKVIGMISRQDLIKAFNTIH